MSYEIKLEQFEGPLDLLVFFIHRDKINIYDIPISHITKEFLEYIKMMKLLQIGIGGDFILMASMLMQIKAKMLLPKSDRLDDDSEILDPRTDLVQKLIEYKQFKDIAISLNEIQEEHSLRYAKGEEITYIHQKEDMTTYLSDVSLFTLIVTFRDLIQNLGENNSYELSEEQINVSEQVDFIRSFFEKRKKINFSELGKFLNTKLRIVVTFMGLLEMLKNNEIDIKQNIPFSEIEIIKVI